MKTIRKGAVIAAIAASVLLASNIHTFAIEGLKIKAQCPNIVLTWPSATGEIYIVRYRPTLDNGSSWTILTNSLPARTGTNTTIFIHPNQIVCSTNTGGGGGGGQGGPPPLPGMATYLNADGTTTLKPSEPLVMPADSSGSAVPIELYPPGFDLTGFLIFDLTTEEWVSGDGQVIAPTPVTESLALSGGIHPMDGGSGGGVTSGFYEVVRVGPHFFGLTNGMVLSGVVSLPMEFGNTNTTASLDTLFLFATNGGPVPNGFTFPAIPSGITYGMTSRWDTTVVPNGTYTFGIWRWGVLERLCLQPVRNEYDGI